MSAYAPQNEAEAALVAAWPQIEPRIVAAAKRKFSMSPWAHEAQERAEEEAQDAFLKCLEAARSGGWDGQKVREYVGVVASREVLDVLRRQKWAAPKRRPAEFADGDEDGAVRAAAAMVDHLTPEAVAVHADAVGDLRGLLGVCMEAVPTRLRRALWLQVYGGLDLDSVGRTLGTTESGARSLVFRAREARRAVLQKEAAARRRGGGVGVRLARFAPPRDPDAPDGCREWFGTRMRRVPFLAIGNVVVDPGRPPVGRTGTARRLRWALAHGPLAPWLDVRAACRTECCTALGCLFAAPAARVRTRTARTDLGDLDGPIPTGAELQRRRLAAGVRAEVLAAVVGCEPKYLCSVERGTLPRPQGRRPSPQRRLRPDQRFLDLRRRIAAALEAYPEAPSAAELRARREALALTATEVGAEAGVDATTVTRVERDGAHGRSTGAHTVVAEAPWRIAAALDRLALRTPPVPDPESFEPRRRALGLSQRQLVAAAGIALSTYTVVTGAKRPIRAGTLRRIGAALERLERERAQGSAA